MNTKERIDLSSLLDMDVETTEELAWSHAMDISGSIYTRMRELGITKGELAKRMDVNPSQITRIIKGNGNMTLKTLAKAERALDFRLDGGFRYEPPITGAATRIEIPRQHPTHATWLRSITTRNDTLELVYGGLAA